jgi:hypothetical protein
MSGLSKGERGIGKSLFEDMDWSEGGVEIVENKPYRAAMKSERAMIKTLANSKRTESSA